jgi:hypothetical protein
MITAGRRYRSNVELLWPGWCATSNVRFGRRQVGAEGTVYKLVEN